MNTRSKICVPIVESSLSVVLEKIKEYSSFADVLEIWLGELFPFPGLENKSKILDTIFSVKKECGIPILFTIKDGKEKGMFGGTHDEKKELILDLFKRGAEYIDVDYEFDLPFFDTLKTFPRKGVLILSAHFFEGTPSFPSLKNRVQLMRNRGAEVVKIACFPESFRDVLSVLRLSENLSRNKIPFITISMGNMGKVSRVLTPLLGGELMFASPEDGKNSASGQFLVKDLEKALETFEWREDL